MGPETDPLLGPDPPTHQIWKATKFISGGNNWVLVSESGKIWFWYTILDLLVRELIF